MMDNYIPLRVNRDFGDIITTYFEFFKQNLKRFTNVFLSYNGIFLIALLVVSYLMVSGFMGVIAYENSSTFGVAREPMDEKYVMLIGAGAILFLVIFLIVAVLNYGLSSSYMIIYEEKKSNAFDKKVVWDLTKSQFGNIVLFILMLILISLGLGIVSFILLIIPFVGILAYYVLIFFFVAWIGVSFFQMMQEKTSVTDALGEGWKLVTNNFWKSVGVNFIMGILINILMTVVLVIPGVLIGIYTFHVVENDVDFVNSVVATVVYTLGTFALLVIMVYGQCLSQFVNGILYYTLHEKTYNVNTRKKIDEIGESL